MAVARRQLLAADVSDVDYVPRSKLPNVWRMDAHHVM